MPFVLYSDWVNPPRHVKLEWRFSLLQVIFMSDCIIMLPFSLFMRKAYFPVTIILDPFFNSMLPLNVTRATCEKFSTSNDAVKLQLVLLWFLLTMEGTVVLISSTSPLSNMRNPSEEKVRRINLRY